MVKLKKPDIGVWKTVESKSRHKHEKEKPKPNKKLRLNSQNKRISNMLVGLKISSKLQNTKSIMKIGNGIIFIQCRFHRIDYIRICHGVLILIYLIFVHHGFIVHICHLFLYICVQITLLIRSWQLVCHHLPIMTVLIKKISLYRKRNTKWLNKSIVSKKDRLLNKNLDLTRHKEKRPLKTNRLVLLIKLPLMLNMFQMIWLNNNQVRLGGKTRKKNIGDNSTGLTSSQMGLTSMPTGTQTGLTSVSSEPKNYSTTKKKKGWASRSF